MQLGPIFDCEAAASKAYTMSLVNLPSAIVVRPLIDIIVIPKLHERMQWR